MTIDELLIVIAREYPNGVSLDPMALRLLRQKIPFEDRQLKDLKDAMFQLGTGLWFSSKMISDDETQLEFEETVTEWLDNYDCCSVERLFKDFCRGFHHIAKTEDCSIFLKHLGYNVAVWEKGCHFCYLFPPNIDDNLTEISETIAEWLEEADGTLPFNEIEQAMPHLTAEALAGIRERFLPEVHEVEVGGVPCWRSTESITLPEDFSEKLTIVVDTMVELDEKVTVSRLGFALNLLYRTRLREEYSLLDDDTFMRVCAKHYHGGNGVFANTKITRQKANDLSAPGRRMRSPNTRFSNLGVPVGAELVFTKGRHISCVVIDDSNQVEYDGKAWAISTLAIHLLGGSSVNGFYYFSYQGETLWERRLRLERAD